MIVQGSSLESCSAVKCDSYPVFLWVIDIMMRHITLHSIILYESWRFFGVSSAKQFVHEFDVVFFVLRVPQEFSFEMFKTSHRHCAIVRQQRPLLDSFLNPAVLAQSVERVDCRAGGRGFDSWGRTNTQGLKITEK